MATNTSILGLTKPAYTDDADVAVINSNSDLIDAEAGRTRANFAAEYSTSSAYAVGAFCTHAGILYQCNTAIGSGGEAWTAAHWTQISAAAAITTNSQAIASVESTTLSPATGRTLSTNSLIKYNRVIQVMVVADSITPASNGWIDIAELPSGDSYRPNQMLDFIGVNNRDDSAIHARIESGVLKFYGLANVSVLPRIFVTFISAAK